MLISPPFLPPSGTFDDDWLDSAMLPAKDGGGAYPITRSLCWHGGVHLNAPLFDGKALPVRAIADGEVVFIRKPTEISADPEHPLNYDAGKTVAGWTSDGCVIIRHDTEIGDTAEGAVSYFSIYMHLEDIEPRLELGRVYRKDKLGKAGYVYGAPGLIHFEIVCNDENLKKIAGRDSSDLLLTKDGRTAVLFGDIHFYVPEGTVFMSDNPLKPPAPGKPAPTAIYTSSQAMFVSIRYAGSSQTSSYRHDGSEIGSALVESDFEYNLYQMAERLSARRPSAALELLRFGRVIGMDALEPADTPCWRCVNYDNGSGVAAKGWVNLASAKIKKYSDADFPHWLGWSLVDDSADVDIRMDSATVMKLLEGKDSKFVLENLGTQLSLPDIQKKLRKVICKFPAEWERAAVEKRWGWLKEKSSVVAEPLTNEDFERLKRHIEKLCFWEDAAAKIPQLEVKHWHFHPAEFIRHFRKCGWLSEQELVQTIPKTVKKLSHTAFHVENIGPTTQIQQRIRRWKRPLNLTLRKYNMDKPLRRMYFFANVWEETGYLRLMVEGNGSQKSYAP